MSDAGVYTAQKKDGSTYYRASITYKGKHISLGSYEKKETAAEAYQEAELIIRDGRFQIKNYQNPHVLPLDKFVILINFRDNNIYFKTPIYLYANYFEYYLSGQHVLTFDRDDLFFYANHKIMQRGGRLFYCDYGNQYSILSRYGLKSYAVAGRDYLFVNGDTNDFRYDNIQLINHYTGVCRIFDKGTARYLVQIHINGNYRVGIYEDETTAAIAYNKAVDILWEHGSLRRYTKNYISGMSSAEYKKRYEAICVSKKLF